MLIASMMAIGCLENINLEPKEATPAIIPEEFLQEKGWIQSGDAHNQTQEIEVSGVKVKMNMAQLTYIDTELQQQIQQQIQQIQQQLPFEIKIDQIVTSQLSTIRITFPIGITLPSKMVLSKIDIQINSIAQKYNIKDFKVVNETEITISSGDIASAKIYEGTIEYDTGSMTVRGIAASWSNSDSTIIAIGFVPYGDINLKINTQNGSVKIDGEEEYKEVISLIQNVK